MDNLFANLPASHAEEIVQTLLQKPGLRIERIVSSGQTSPPGFWYDQSEGEWVIVLQGAARLQFEDRVCELGPGDFVHILPHQKHRVDWTSPQEPTVWLAVFYQVN